MTIHELLALTGLTGSDEIPVWDEEASGEPTKKITAQNFAAAIKTLASLLGTGDVVNNLTSTDPTKVLAASQGKALNDNITHSSTSQEISTLYYKQFGNVIVVSGKLLGNDSNNVDTGFPYGYCGVISVRNQATGSMSLYYHDNTGHLTGWDGTTNRIFQSGTTFQISGVLFPYV